jgi:hypothetical protein
VRACVRFEQLLHDRLGVEVVKEDEIATIVHGVSFVLENAGVPGELYAVEHTRYVRTRGAQGTAAVSSRGVAAVRARQVW